MQEKNYRGVSAEQLLWLLENVADKEFDGHLTIMKFTTNWRVGFGTVEERSDNKKFAPAGSFEEAAAIALATRNNVYDKTDQE